ncbi:hypothetical protein H0H92_003752, partial [Tricholoma furcatifolium]
MDTMDEDYDMGGPPDPIQPPLPSDMVSDGSSSFIVATWNETPKAGDVASFLARWPPSQTPIDYADWIAVERGPHSTSVKPQDLVGLAADWEVLKKRAEEQPAEQTVLEPKAGEQPTQHVQQNSVVTVEALDALARAHSVLTGKWLIYAKPYQVDDLWSRIVTKVVANAPSGIGARAKVSPARPEEPHVICVYVDDYNNMGEVERVRVALRRVGVRWKIGFKPDIYTHLGIYKSNHLDDDDQLAPQLDKVSNALCVTLRQTLGHESRYRGIYVGMEGTALLERRLSKCALALNDDLSPQILSERGDRTLMNCLRAPFPGGGRRTPSRASFLETEVGLATLGLIRVLETEEPNSELQFFKYFERCLQIIRGYLDDVDNYDEDSCEVLYGRAGLLYALLLLTSSLSRTAGSEWSTAEQGKSLRCSLEIL